MQEIPEIAAFSNNNHNESRRETQLFLLFYSKGERYVCATFECYYFTTKGSAAKRLRCGWISNDHFKKINNPLGPTVN